MIQICLTGYDPLWGYLAAIRVESKKCGRIANFMDHHFHDLFIDK